MSNKLYVGNLSHDIDNSALKHINSDHGTVYSAKVITDLDTGQGKGIAFVEMNKGEEAKATITALNGEASGSSQLKVNKDNSDKYFSHRVGCGAPF